MADAVLPAGNHPLLIQDRGGAILIFLGVVVLLLVAACALVPLEDGAGEDAAIRQQERVPGDDQHAGRHSAGADHARGAGSWVPTWEPQQNDVANYQIYAGTSGPYNFNGLVRHYYLRSQPNQADIQVNLLPADVRSTQSHEIAKRMRPGAGSDCTAVRSANQASGGAAGTAGAADAGGRNLWNRASQGQSGSCSAR